MKAKSFGRQRPSDGALAGPEARNGGGCQGRCQPMAGLLERCTSQICNTSVGRRGFRVSASPFELHSKKAERLNLIPFTQPIVGCLMASGRETFEEIDGRIVTTLLRNSQRFAHPIVEPHVIHALTLQCHRRAPSCNHFTLVRRSICLVSRRWLWTE